MLKNIIAIGAILLAISLYGQQNRPVERAGTPEKAPNVKSNKKVQSQTDLTSDKGELKALYQQLKTLEENAQNEIKSLKEEMKNLTPEERLEKQRRAEQIKRNTERQSLDIKLKIAQLRGDKRLISDIKEAIDHLDHPDKYLPKTKPVERENQKGKHKRSNSDLKVKKSSGLR